MKITQRERELLKLIDSNPMISQDQLAQKLDILVHLLVFIFRIW